MQKLYTRKAIKLLIVIFISWNAISCEKDNDISSTDDTLNSLLIKASGGRGKAYFKLPSGANLAEFPQDPRNRLTPEKVALGKILFHETCIGSNPKNTQGMMTYSCASCHHVDAGFQAGIAQGIGEGGIGFGTNGELRKLNPSYPTALIDVQPIRSPTVLNTAYQELMLWNGQFGAVGKNAYVQYAWTPGTPKETNLLGFQGLETQAIAGQNVHRLKIDKSFLNNIASIKDLFDLAFADIPETGRMTPINAGLAIAAYERTLVSNEAPFQKWLNGDNNAMTETQKQGALLFFGKAGCVQCHTGPALNSMEFYALGTNDLLTGTFGAINAGADKAEHKGRGGFTGKAEDMYKFKVPQLYNLKGIKFLGHGAQFESVKEVLDYKNKAIKSNAIVPDTQLAGAFKPLNLTDDEIEKLRVFIEDGLYDANIKRYAPLTIPSGFCFPDNDTQSRIDKGCQ